MPPGYIQCADSNKLPKDTVSCSKWSQETNPPIFAVSSWDGTFRIYSVTPESFTLVYIFERDMPITAFATTPSFGTVFLGYLNGTVVVLNTQSGAENLLTEHNCPLRSIFFVEQENLVVTFDVANKMKAIVASSGQTFEHNFDFRISCVDFKDPYFAVGFLEDKYAIFNLSVFKTKSVTYAANPLKSPLSCIQLSPSSNEVLMGSYDGRVACIGVSEYSKQPGHLMFKAHTTSSIQAQGSVTLHQVNSMALGVIGSTNFVLTAGSEGKLYNWEYVAREKFREHSFNMPVVEVCLHPELKLVLICLGYDWSLGAIGMEKVNYQPQIVVYPLTNDDFKNPTKTPGQ